MEKRCQSSSATNREGSWLNSGVHPVFPLAHTNHRPVCEIERQPRTVPACGCNQHDGTPPLRAADLYLAPLVALCQPDADQTWFEGLNSC